MYEHEQKKMWTQLNTMWTAETWLEIILWTVETWLEIILWIVYIKLNEFC